jgi:hypothetical protein
MPAQKKKKTAAVKGRKTKPKTPKEPREFKWTGQRKKAALLLSGGTKKYEEVATEVRVNISTLREWRKLPVFLAEVDRLTLENEKATRAGLVRAALKALDEKKDTTKEDKTTTLEWLKFIADLQGHSKQKIELDANLDVKSSLDYKKLSDEELDKAIEDEIKKRSEK